MSRVHERTIGWRAETGFTLIELLVVIIIIAILAAIAIPTYFGVRMKAQDSAAITLVRNALTTVEGANLNFRDYAQLDAAELRAMEPSISWQIGTSELVDPSVPTIVPSLSANAAANEVEFFADTATSFDIATVSESGNRFGIRVQTAGGAATDYIKVSVVEETGSNGW